MHKYFGCVLQVVGAGGIGAFLQSLLIYVLGQFGLFSLLRLPLEFPFDLVWFYQRISWGGLWGLVFLLPFWRGAPHLKRGIILGILPALLTLLLFLPFKDGHGYLGLNLGFMMPVVVLFFNVVWGMITGWLCDLARPHRDEEPVSPTSATGI